jgi:hypothetical protein
MDKKTKVSPNIPDIAGKIFHLLEGLSSETRRNIIRASLMMLGESGTDGVASSPTLEATGGPAADPTLIGLSPKGASWIKHNGLTLSQVERVFDISNQGVSVIAPQAPGNNDKQKTHNAYVLLGVSRLLASGEAAFEDKAARKVCEELGCYDSANHSVYMRDKGNVIAGSKKKGWKLTAPGLKHGAELVRELTKEG